jgi:hypothetical protein
MCIQYIQAVCMSERRADFKDYTLKKFSDIPAEEGNIANLFLQCKSLWKREINNMTCPVRPYILFVKGLCNFLRS